MRRFSISFIFFLGIVNYIFCQDSIESIKSNLALKKDEAKAINQEILNLKKQISEFPGWTIDGVGIVGLDLSANDNWFAIDNPYSTSNGYGFTGSVYAKLNKEKVFWNSNLNFNWKKQFNIIDSREGEKTETITDILEISTLAGYKFSKKWAFSAEAKYASSILNFNNPGKLTISAGGTWIPGNNLVVNFHPLAYELNFPGDFVSTLGCNIGITYDKEIIPGLSWSTNFKSLIPYSKGTGTLNAFEVTNGFERRNPKAEFDKDKIDMSTMVDYGPSDLFNWTWSNTLSIKLIKGIGVGLNFGLRKDRQIANQWQYNRDLTYTPNSSNPIQFYYNLGVAYTL